MKKASTTTKDNYAKALDELMTPLLGRLRQEDISALEAIILCFAKLHLFKDGAFSPDPNDADTPLYNKIWESFRNLWSSFDDNNIRELHNIIAKIEEKPISKADCVIALDRYISSKEAFGYEIYIQPEEITTLGYSLLGYKDGSVYNPFAGAASYGLKLNIGEQYYGEEINERVWAIGTLRLLINGNLSHNYVLGNSEHFALGNSATEPGRNLFDYVITTPPFGIKIGIERMSVEEFLLYRSEHLLSDNGTMVMFASASFVNKSGKFRAIRERLTVNNMLDTVIALPKETFQPATSLNTVALIIKKHRGEEPVRFLDARDCVSHKKIDTGEILRRLKDDNYTIQASLDAIRKNDFCWHPAKYIEEIEDNLEPGFSRIKLRELIIQSGSTETPNTVFRSISMSDLSSDPFNFTKKPSDILNKKDDAFSKFEQSQSEIKQYEELITSLNSRKALLESRLNELSNVSKNEQMRLGALSMASSERLYKEEEECRHKIDDVEKRIAESNEKLKRAVSETTNGLNHAYIHELNQTAELLDRQKREIEERVKLMHERAEKENAIAREALNAKITSAEKDVRELQHELRDIDVQREIYERKLGEIKQAVHSLSIKYTKASHPVLILGGSKPKLKFLYISASPEAPVYISSSHCYAFKVDTKRVDIGFLVYQISELVFKDYGETIPLISLDAILNSTIAITDIKHQLEYLKEREFRANPYRKEIHDLKLQLKEVQENAAKEEARLTAALGSKQHDMGNLVPKIVCKFADLFDSIDALPDEIETKQAILRQIEILGEEMKDLNKIIKIISEKEDFPAPEKIDLVKFFTRYQATHPGVGYDFPEIRFDKYDLQDGGIFVPVSEIAITRALLNIRDNAEMHGFEPDTSGREHYFQISIHVDQTAGVCHIDFSNNGLPMEKGMTAEIYGTKGEKSRNTGHTGNGGWYVWEMAKFYHGKCSINPKDTDPELTTIRITLPLYHD